MVPGTGAVNTALPFSVNPGVTSSEEAAPPLGEKLADTLKGQDTAAKPKATSLTALDAQRLCQGVLQKWHNTASYSCQPCALGEPPPPPSTNPSPT